MEEEDEQFRGCLSGYGHAVGEGKGCLTVLDIWDGDGALRDVGGQNDLSDIKTKNLMFLHILEITRQSLKKPTQKWFKSFLM